MNTEPINKLTNNVRSSATSANVEIDGAAEARSAETAPCQPSEGATGEGLPEEANSFEFFRQFTNDILMKYHGTVLRSRARRPSRPRLELHRYVLAAAGGRARARRSPAATPPSTDGTGGGDGDGDDDSGPLVELPVELIRPHPLSAQIYNDGPDQHLVEGIRQHGLLHPLVVTPRGAGYLLLAGHRRFGAIRVLGWTTVSARVVQVAPEDDAELIIEANRSREKTASQRLREAQALEPIYARRARERQRAGGTSATTDAEVGRTSDQLAAAVGLGSGKTLERLQEIARARPDLLGAVDAGRKKISGAWAEMRREQKRQAHVALAGAVVPRADVLLGDARELLPTLAAGRFAAIVTDPPYGVSQDGVMRERAGTVPLSSDFGAWDHLSDADAEVLIAFCALEFFRVLRPGGALFLFPGDQLLPYWVLALKRAGFALPRPYLLAWTKPIPRRQCASAGGVRRWSPSSTR